MEEHRDLIWHQVYFIDPNAKQRDYKYKYNSTSVGCQKTDLLVRNLCYTKVNTQQHLEMFQPKQPLQFFSTLPKLLLSLLLYFFLEWWDMNCKCIVTWHHQ